MAFRVLDASAFYAGVPFRASGTCYTTSLIYEEIRHIKKSHGVLEMLLETGRLVIREPCKRAWDTAAGAAKDTGDYPQLSRQDISVIALAVELGGDIISDDFAISNVAKNMGLGIFPIMTKGIIDVGVWVRYCPGCGAVHPSRRECLNCGAVLRRRLVKKAGKKPPR